AIIGIFCVTRNMPVAGGILVGLSTALKPQIGGPFFIYFLIHRRWGGFSAAIVTLSCLLLIGIIPFIAHGSLQATLAAWQEQSMEELGKSGHLTAQRGRLNSGPLLNLDAVLVYFVDSEATRRALSIGLIVFP